MNLKLQNFFFSSWISMARSFTNDLLTVLMVLMVEKCIRGGICHSIYKYVKANNKYMEGYDKNKESSFTQYLDVNNLYG